MTSGVNAAGIPTALLAAASDAEYVYIDIINGTGQDITDGDLLFWATSNTTANGKTVVFRAINIAGASATTVATSGLVAGIGIETIANLKKQVDKGH